MSIETDITMDEARRRAAKVVRQELGTFPRLGQGEYDRENNKFQFHLFIRSPKIISDDRRDEVVDIRYYNELDLGSVTVDGDSGEVNRPNRSRIRKKIREQENEVEIAVQKALISAAGRKFSHLPFPENQYSPLEDILAELILNGQMSMDQIETMDENRSNDRYHEYLQKLLELDLAEQDDEVITNGSVLIDLLNETDSYQEALNGAIGRYFEANIGEFMMIKRTLGPYLVIAGRYYRRALELDELPVVEEAELRRAIKYEYSGKNRERKLVKLSRYLIQLEDVGILESVSQDGKQYWVGKERIRDDLRDQSQYLATVQPLIA